MSYKFKVEKGEKKKSTIKSGNRKAIIFAFLWRRPKHLFFVRVAGTSPASGWANVLRATNGILLLKRYW